MSERGRNDTQTSMGIYRLPTRRYLTDRSYQKIKEIAVRDLRIADLEQARQTSEYQDGLKSPAVELEKLLKMPRGKLAVKAPNINLERAAWFNRSLRLCLAEDYIELQEMPETAKIYGTDALIAYGASLKKYEKEQRRKNTDWGRGNAELADNLQGEVLRIITDKLNHREIIQRMQGKGRDAYFKAVVEYLVEKSNERQKALNKVGRGIQIKLKEMIANARRI